jgi:uncharacterized protein (TIGR02217 family)
MVDFVESPRFPDDIAEGSSGGPNWKTDIFESQDGTEVRNMVWEQVRHVYDVSYGIRDKESMDVVRAFFFDVRGRAFAFRFKDWGDYELTDENIGTGDGTNLVFPITKSYGANNPYVRRIFKPVAGTLSVSVAASVVDPDNYTVDYTTGVITFGSGHAPAASAAVTVSCEFDVPVRFDTDALSSTHDGWLTEEWNSIPIKEVKLEDA